MVQILITSCCDQNIPHMVTMATSIGLNCCKRQYMVERQSGGKRKGKVQYCECTWTVVSKTFIV